uniref:Uncharacterized protein n=1 Tax=viral metagenome TaxID=1070528 RepID=A0A6M3JN88_9ZZZZ
MLRGYQSGFPPGHWLFLNYSLFGESDYFSRNPKIYSGQTKHRVNNGQESFWDELSDTRNAVH